MTDNPYASPHSQPREAEDGALPPRYGLLAMAGWGLVGGIMLGATCGAIAGGIMGAVDFCLLAILGGEEPLHEATLVVLWAAGTVAGALAGMATGGVVGPPLGVIASRPSIHGRRTTLAVLASSILAVSATAIGSAVGAALPGPLLIPGGVLGALTGALGGIRLGRLLWDLAWLQPNHGQG